MTKKYAQLDISLLWNETSDGFKEILVFDDPDDIQDRQEIIQELVHIDLNCLKEALGNPERYGNALSGVLFSTELATTFVDRALATADVLPVHLRLVVDPRAPAPYQAILWETLTDPVLHRPITTRENVLFSRYLSDPGWRHVTTLARRTTLRTLIVVADPSDLNDYVPPGLTHAPLSRLEVVRVQEQAEKALKGMKVTRLPDDQRHATLTAILEELREGVDILYLVCHGSFDKGPMLYLENDQGAVDEIPGKLLAQSIGDLQSLPAITVLCSCQSAGAGSDTNMSQNSLSAVGPLLAEVGVAAVVAMQGNVGIETTSTFFTEFFRELSRNGLPDLAMAVARGAVKARPDWWMPVLYSRLKRGRPWYVPGFGGRERVVFSFLREFMTAHMCTPVLGSSLAPLKPLPTREDLASDFVALRQLPISKSSRRDLAKVAQYLSVDGGQAMPIVALINYLRVRLQENFSSELPRLDWSNGELQDLISAVGKAERAKSGKDDPYTMLAKLQLPVYVTTVWHRLLEDALRDAGRSPVVRSFEWYDDTHNEDDLFETDIAHPLVYHLFGTLENQDSMVLTEDDYFAWLRSWMRRVDNDKSIPSRLTSSLTEGSLLFLGYNLDDWEFRVLFQSIKAFRAAGKQFGGRRKHVGVQLRPDTVTIELEAAQEYLESYFGRDSVNIYWESSSNFLRELLTVIKADNE